MVPTRWHELLAGPSLDEPTRAAMAERVVRWLLVPLWLILTIGVSTVLMTVGLSEPTRLLPPAIFFACSLLVAYLARRRRWLAAAAALSGIATVTIALSALLNSVHAPLYRAGVLLVWLVVPLFGARWGVAAVAAMVLAGAAWFGLDALGLSTGVQTPPATLVYAGYVLHLLISIGLVSVPQRLLVDSLRDAKRKRQEAEEARNAAAASELALDAVFEQSSVALALLTAQGLIVRLNARAASLFGATDAGSLLGRSLPSVVAWTDQQRELLLQAIDQAARGELSRHELVLPRPADKPGDFHVTFSPFHDSSSVGGVIVEAVDVSALIEARSMLAQARRLESLGKLSGGVAHDINNMLGAIGGAAELIRNDLRRRDTEGVLESTALIQSSVLRAASLTKQLLAFGRQDRFNSEQIDVHRLVSDVARLLQRTLHKNVEIVHVAREAAAHVRGDAAALEHALLNLALNAQDAMPNGGTITLLTERIELDAAGRAALSWDTPPGPAVLISVTDTGTGMSPEVQERAFDPFFTTKALTQGTGLGLSAVHGTVRSHSGAITMRSHEGFGTTFQIYLPAIDVAGETPREVVTSPPPAMPHLHARVLLADDERLVRDAVGRMLESLGCEVEAVDSGEALMGALAQGTQPDLVVTDLAMPGLAGVKLVQALEHSYPDLPLLLITGFTGDDVATALPARKLRKLLRKPFERAELARSLRELLHERSLQASESAQSA